MLLNVNKYTQTNILKREKRTIYHEIVTILIVSILISFAHKLLLSLVKVFWNISLDTRSTRY